MMRTKVESSNIAAIGHDSETSTLEIEFNTGAIYQYKPVSFKLYRELMDAESKGKFFHKRIKYAPDIAYTKVN